MITEHITAYHCTDARHMLEDAGLTPLRITEVQSTDDDEDLIVPMFLKEDRGSLMTLAIFFFCLASSIMLSMYGVFTALNYLYALLKQ